ncbi:MAG: triose-phosphate isomerase [Sulfuricurvum sp.]|uniref:triose-phosphate isomerase n=1 Tax=Sulfuricurvum sp. TaxID=2025608 RepID=UPI002637A56E|nr:triose-phosphate isomerase [Sulfuricurvum sp.]MDD2367777.1 triose-phosphate isomerase [Sulfuricurvum sp.]MDD2949795.1 triose-phosphate isomerase [Sulfuricurvum sp.]MDD5118400.1 triose-phosphate isomerase [Sulfuricurvum sp.]
MILCANFKANKTRQDTRAYMAVVESFVSANNIDDTIIVFPPFTALEHLPRNVLIGVQNAYPAQNGAFTGEITLEQLEEFEIKTILIGHSERRHILGETQEQIAAKFRFFAEQGFVIVYCVGEPLSVREEGISSLMTYIEAQFEGIDLTYPDLIVAYEPVWAIGTGLTPSSQDIEQVHGALREKTAAPLLYGGSVKVDNAGDIMALENVDGVLVGSAALSAHDFCDMVAQASELNMEKGE